MTTKPSAQGESTEAPSKAPARRRGVNAGQRTLEAERVRARELVDLYDKALSSGGVLVLNPDEEREAQVRFYADLEGLLEEVRHFAEHGTFDRRPKGDAVLLEISLLTMKRGDESQEELTNAQLAELISKRLGLKRPISAAVIYDVKYEAKKRAEEREGQSAGIQAPTTSAGPEHAASQPAKAEWFAPLVTQQEVKRRRRRGSTK